MMRKLMLIVSILLIAFTASISNADRVVIALRDITPSFKFGADSNKGILLIANALGPGDTFILADIGSTFLPEKNVKFQCRMPNVSQDILQPVGNLVLWRQNQAKLNRTWSEVDQVKKKIAELLKVPVKEEDTDFYTALEYCSLRFSSETQKEKFLFIFSDLTEDLRGEPNEDPPSVPLGFNGVHVHILFCPWHGQAEWKPKKQAWQAWFVGKGKAKEFTLHEPGESKLIKLLEKSPVPRKLKSPFDSE